MAIGLVQSMKKRNWVIMFVIYAILWLIIGVFSIRITFNFFFLIYKSIQMNSAEAQLFFTLNFVSVLLPIHLISHFTEAETK